MPSYTDDKDPPHSLSGLMILRCHLVDRREGGRTPVLWKRVSSISQGFPSNAGAVDEHA